MYEHWHDKHQASTLTGMSVKTIERLAAKGEIQQAERPRPGLRPATVYNPDDIGRIKAEREPGAFLMPQTAPPVSQPGAMVPAAAPVNWGTWLERFAPAPPPQPPTIRRFLTIAEAAEASGLSMNFLRHAIKTASLPAVRDGRTWKVRRDDLDKL